MSATLTLNSKTVGCLRPLRLIYLFLIVAFTALAASARESAQLLGAIADNRGGVALVKNRASGEIKAFRLGMDVFEFGTLVEVTRSTATIEENGGNRVTISSKLGGGLLAGPKTKPIDDGERYIEDGFQRIGNKIEVDARYRDRMVKEELQNILMQATAEPVMTNGEIVGFKIYQFDQNSIFHKLGLKEGDVVKEINGVPLNNVAKTIQFLNGLREEPKVEVAVNRNGEPVSLQMNVK